MQQGKLLAFEPVGYMAQNKPLIIITIIIIPVIRKTKCKLPIIREIRICMFS